MDFILDVLGQIGQWIHTIFDWLIWFIFGLFNGDVWHYLLGGIVSFCSSILSSLFNYILGTNLDFSFPAEYCPYVAWFFPVDDFFTGIGVYGLCLTLRFTVGWVLKFAQVI